MILLAYKIKFIYFKLTKNYLKEKIKFSSYLIFI